MLLNVNLEKKKKLLQILHLSVLSFQDLKQQHVRHQTFSIEKRDHMYIKFIDKSR